MRLLPAFCLLALTFTVAHAAEPCQRFHGRLSYYSGDGQFRLWHVGTHHEFEPAEEDASAAGPRSNGYPNLWGKAFSLLQGDADSPVAASNRQIYADVEVCPTEPFRKGAVQAASLRSMKNVRVVLRN